MSKLKNYILMPVVVIALINLTSYFVSIFVTWELIKYQILYAVLFSLLILIFLTEKNSKFRTQVENITYFLTFFILFLVENTGGFDSPFTFTLYFLVVVQSFFFQPVVSILQVFFFLTAIVVFNTELDTNDFLTMVSLLALVPVSIYLREHYLMYKEAKNKILILEQRELIYADSVEQVLDNSVHNFSARLREYLSTIKFISLRLSDYKSIEKQQTAGREITHQADLAIKYLKDFEEDTTGQSLLSDRASSRGNQSE